MKKNRNISSDTIPFKTLFKVFEKTAFIVGSILVMLLSESNKSFAQENPPAMTDTVTYSFWVNGNTYCKTKIDSVASTFIENLSVNWNASDKQLTLRFLLNNPAPVNLIHLRLAEVGFDSEGFISSEEAYNALPSNYRYARITNTNGN